MRLAQAVSEAGAAGPRRLYPEGTDRTQRRPDPAGSGPRCPVTGSRQPPRLTAKMCIAVWPSWLETSGKVIDATVFDESTGTVVANTYIVMP
jgi:hypothetical protein